MKSLRIFVLFTAIVLLAAALRFPALSQRPMHCDEAVHADKFGTLLEGRGYEYDPAEYHGPTLYYLTLPSAWIRGQLTYVALDETTLRLIPAVFGTALVALHVFLIPFIGTVAAAVAALLTAISPGMVFYSRYYIHEMLLVFFGFAAFVAACWYLRRPAVGAALMAGASIGLMHATKESTPIMLGSMLVAVAASYLAERRGRGSPSTLARIVRGRDLVMGLSAALLVSVVMFSSIFTHPRGIIDSVRTYWIYFERVNAITWHFHPWDYYLRLLIHFPAQGTPFWTEAVILVLGAIGGVAGWLGKGIPGVSTRLLRILGIYTLVMIVGYSAIPYKTPWCLLGFLHGLILLAGAATVFLWNVARTPAARAAVAVLLVAAATHLGWQAWAGSFRFDADPRNPYVYAHTGKDVFTITRRIEDLALADPRGLSTPVDIISRENLWPLPWYLRRLKATRWWNGVSESAPSAPIILASPDMEPELIRKLYELPPPGERELYMNIFERYVELRPQVELRGYAAKTLWDAYRRRQAEEPDRQARVRR